MDKSIKKLKTLGQKFIEGFGSNNLTLLDETLADNVKFYGALGWGIEGKDNVINFTSQFQKGFPGFKVVLHDEFYNAKGDRGNIRMHLHFSNSGVFMGHEPTGKVGISVESFSFKIKEKKIIEIVQSGNTFSLAAIEIIDFKWDYPIDTPDPNSPILLASKDEVNYY